MRTLNITLATAAAAMVVLAGCDDKKVASAVDKTKSAASSAADTAKDAANKGAEAMKDAAAKTADAAKSATDSAKAATADWMDAAKAKFESAGGASAGLTKFVDGAKAQIATLKDKAKNAPPAVKSVVDPMITQIDQQVATLSAKADELKKATPENWKSIWDSAKPTMDKLGELVKQVNAKLAG